MDCSCILSLSPKPLIHGTFIVLSYLITGQLFPLTYGVPVSKTDNFTRSQADYTDFSYDLSLSHTFSNSKVLCYNKTDGMYRHSQSLNSYYMCNKGVYQSKQCSQGHEFNEISSKCEKRVTGLVESNPCDSQQDSFIPDYSSNCQQYYRCQSGSIVEKKRCNDGIKFSYTDQSCLLADQVNCIQTHCQGSADGYYVTPGSMCKAYYTCISEVKKDYICPTGLVFDRSSQTCTGSGGVCYELICTGRVNGLYADTTHGCERYYNCEGGYVKSVAGCPAGFLFNGSNCVNKSFVYCSSAENTAISLSLPTTDICTGLPDGANSVSDEYCQAYVLCKSRMTIAELQCPIGQNFDGHKCINAELAPCSSFCADKSNGYHANIRKNCQEYVNCVDGRIINIQKCPDGTIFNGEICIECSSYNCPVFIQEQNINRRQCLNLKDGFHTDYLTGCKDYFYCHKGEVLVRNSCSDNTVWNGRECVSKNDYSCEIFQVSPECSVRGNGFFTDISKASNCNKYYYCNNGVQVQLRCPFNQVFNGYNCVSPELYECPIVEMDCHDKSDGYYTDMNSGCQSYYYCSNGNRITYLCPDDHVFNGNSCVQKHFYSCPGNLSDDCHNLHNGYYPEIQSGCQKYFYCLNNKKIMTFMCSSKEIFDGFKCVSAATNMCQIYTKISCNLLQDNVYIKPDSNCAEYFQCNNRKITALSKCNDGYVFNGTTCIRAAPELCNKLMRKQTEDLSNCNKKNNGFFPDLISRCTSYFYCIDGIKTSLTCPQGKFFNGAVCVSDINFQCPTNLVQLNT